MSTLRTNALEGMDAKNSITIVAGAGNITTTNVQEGLSKVWSNTSADGTTLNDSLNVSSLGDSDTGQQNINFTNAMGNDDYCYTALGGDTSASLSVRIENASNRTTTTIDLISYNTSNASLDIQDVNSLFHGDLA